MNINGTRIGRVKIREANVLGSHIWRLHDGEFNDGKDSTASVLSDISGYKRVIVTKRDDRAETTTTTEVSAAYYEASSGFPPYISAKRTIVSAEEDTESVRELLYRPDAEANLLGLRSVVGTLATAQLLQRHRVED